MSHLYRRVVACYDYTGFLRPNCILTIYTIWTGMTWNTHKHAQTGHIPGTYSKTDITERLPGKTLHVWQVTTCYDDTLRVTCLQQFGGNRERQTGRAKSSSDFTAVQYMLTVSMWMSDKGHTLKIQHGFRLWARLMSRNKIITVNKDAKIYPNNPRWFLKC